MVSVSVQAGVLDHGMIMNVAFGNLGDPALVLVSKRGVKVYGKRSKIGFNQAGKQQVRNGILSWKSEQSVVK